MPIRAYKFHVNVTLPNRLESKLSPEELRLDLAVGMYSSGRVTMGMAAEVAGLSIPEFQRELGQRHIPVNYTEADLTYDLQAAAEIARR